MLSNKHKLDRHLPGLVAVMVVLGTGLGLLTGHISGDTSLKFLVLGGISVCALSRLRIRLQQNKRSPSC